MLSPEILIKNLNPSQKKAVETLNGPLLILAGAGSGKTRVLTHRMVNMIAQGLAAPDEILCVTFTNKAAREMESRIFKLLSDVDFPIRADLWISTFHSFCVRVLRKNLELLDYKPFFTIYDSSDQLSVVKKTLQALNINDKMFPPKNFLGRISNAKMLGLTPETIEKNPRGIMDRKSLEVYTAYEAELKKANALDFDDLLLKTHLLFQMYPDLLKEYQNKFKYILVDEYQDTNHIQYLLVQMLAKAHRNLAVVGDEDQSIYSWRGADITNILNFEKDFPEAVVIKLEENYRSSGNIVKAATAVIKNNLQRKDKTLFTSNEDGSLIRIREEKNEYDEARFAAKTIETLLNEGQYAHNDFAVFYRTNAQSRVIEEQLRTLGIPYKIVGGVRFYERMEIKDILGYLKLSLNPADDLSFKRIINVPTRGIGKTTVEKLEEFATANKLTLMDALPQSLDQRLFNAGTTGKLRRFFELMTELKSSALEFKIHDFYHIVLERSGYLVALKKDESPEAQARIQNLEELDNAISQFVKERGDEGTLQSFLEEMALVSEADNLDDNLNSVTLMTLHISKGLEYPNVFIVGMEENLFPSRSFEEGSNEEDLEEERRLAYVGMTRARENLWLTYTRMRRVWGQEQMNPPSRFIKEIPKELSEFKTSVESGGFFQRHSSRDTTDYGFGQYNNKASFHSNFENEVQRFPEDEERSVSSSQYAKGTQVRHPTFGVGSVFSTEGEGEQLKVSILFADQTIKKFVVKYARLEKV
ncbi:MAG: UvrD-helicase domain-containing protein [Bdellovibrionota bacterium]